MQQVIFTLIDKKMTKYLTYEYYKTYINIVR